MKRSDSIPRTRKPEHCRSSSEPHASNAEPAPADRVCLDVSTPIARKAPIRSILQLQIDQLVARAGQERASGQGTVALRSYQEAIALGADRADIYYGYGVLLQEHDDHQRAVDVLRRASASEEYAISAQYALGESLRALGQTREAAEAFENTLRLVDLSTIGRGEADDLIVMYQAAAECYIELGELSRAASLYGTIATVFQNKRWGRELAEQFRTKATELTERSMVAKLRIMGTGALPVERIQTREPEVVPEEAPAQTWGTRTVADLLPASGGCCRYRRRESLPDAADRSIRCAQFARGQHDDLCAAHAVADRQCGRD